MEIKEEEFAVLSVVVRRGGRDGVLGLNSSSCVLSCEEVFVTKYKQYITKTLFVIGSKFLGNNNTCLINFKFLT